MSVSWRRGFVLVIAVAVAVSFAASGALAASPKWSVVLPHNSSKTQRNGMDGVSCVATNDCFAVGGYFTGTNPTFQHTEIEKWNGSAWSIVASPNKTGSTIGSNILGGISCVVSNFCMAVGYYTQTGGHPEQTLVEKWNGTAWSIVASPNVGVVSNDLHAVSCVSSSLCFAVGDTINGSFVTQTLVERWNGSTWTRVTSANRGTASTSNFLWGVSCSTATFCMADGYYDAASGEFTLIEKWNGSAWSVVTSPNHSGAASSPADDLWTVSCTKSVTNFCLAAGDYLNAGFHQQTLVEKWNGTSWSVLSSPNISTTSNDGLYSGISCPTTTFCMDSTFTNPNSGHEQTLILEWSGSALSIVPSANTSAAQDNRLQATSCLSSAFCVAVGQYESTSTSQTLAEVWR